MLSNLFKKKEMQVLAPITGRGIALEQVPDPVFSEKMMGEGIAIIPEKGSVHSPVEGIVILVADTKHAVGLRTKDGIELLIHIGLETVSLKGQGFKTHVNVGDSVSIGQLLIEADWAYLKENASSIITPIVVTNGSSKAIKIEYPKNCVAGETVLMTISPK